MGKRFSQPVIRGVMCEMHHKCVGGVYPRGDNVARFPVPADKVSWQAAFPEYQPRDYTDRVVLNRPVWADLDLRTDAAFSACWNSLDGKVDRRSHTGPYSIVNGMPRNPVGRTGICSRGTLGRWGPNHAADPIVTRWKRDGNGEICYDSESKKPLLQFVAIQRSDSGEWAIPGGMVDPGEAVSETLKREFTEEALNHMQSKDPSAGCKDVSELFHQGIEVYKGYVDDPRNTDNSWMETVAMNFHDEAGDSAGRFRLHAGDDAVHVQWTDVNRSLKLFANHVMFLEKVACRHQAHW